jgi:hypothetical protein
VLRSFKTHLPTLIPWERIHTLWPPDHRRRDALIKCPSSVGSFLAAVLVVAVPIRVMSQESGGTVVGHITDRATGRGVPSVNVSVVGTSIRTLANDSGFYRLRRVPAGTQVVRAVRLGYTANTTPVTVTDGGTTTADIPLTPASVTLTTVEVTVTGQSKEARETATLTPQLTPDSLNLAAAPNFAGVLEGSAPGVQVTQETGTSGTGARIRIRGSSSVSLSNEPPLVIDGVEVDNEPNAIVTSLGVGGQDTSRINDINPDDISTVRLGRRDR